MSSCFNGDGHARQLRSPVRTMVLALAMLASGAAYAQSVATVDSAETYVTGPAMQRTTLGTTPLRLGHRTEGFGQEASETAIGGRGAVDLAGAVGFVDGQFRISNESRFGTNVGGGVRWYADDYLTGAQRILGVSGWYDGQETILNNYFNQGGVSFESLGEFIDFRVNANIPFEDEKTGDQTFISGELDFIGNSLAQATIVPTDVALRVVDVEAAVRVYDLNAWIYGGGYQFDGNGVSDGGPKVGARGYITNDLAIDVGVTDDDTFGTNTVFQIMWMPGRTGAGPTSWIHTLADRMREPVYRNTYIATQQVESRGSIALTEVDGDLIRIVHVDSTAAPGGDGTFERPLNDLSTIEANSQQGDIILAHSLSNFTGQTATIRNEQRFLGEGDNNNHTVVTSQLGTVTIPETAPGAQGLARPVINNGMGVESVLLSSLTEDGAAFAPIEVSNFRFVGGNSAIDTTTGVGAVNINRLQVVGTDDNAIDLTPITETLANGTLRQRFSPTIRDVTFDNVSGDNIRLDGETPLATTAIVEAIVISDITSTNTGNVAGAGVGINLINTKRAATITDYSWNGGTTAAATSIGALRIENAGAQANVTMNGTNTITGGLRTDTENSGYAIKLVGGLAATHTITGTTINDTGGDTIIVEGGTSNMNFTGSIEQSVNAASILDVSGGHDGNLTFTELTNNAGVIQATTGDGLQFNNADGNYTFNDEVQFTGTSSAINVVNGSDAVLLLANGQFTNTTGNTITFAGGDGNLTFNGKIEQDQNALVLSVTGGHNGVLIFNDLAANPGVIEAINGGGLFFENADGAYTFNDKVTLDGGNAHIEIREGTDAANGSEGTFLFADTDITDPDTSAAVIIDDSEVIFTYTGTITSNNTDAVELTNNSGGSITFNSTIASTQGLLIQDNSAGTISFADAITLTLAAGDGIRILENTGANVTFSDTVDSTLELLIQDNTAGTFAFTGQVTLTGTSDGVNILNNTGGTTSFNNIDITKTGAGTGFVATSAAAGHTVTVTGNDNNISTQTGTALNLNTIAAGAAGINFESVSSNGAVNGIIINNVTGGPVNIGTNAAAGLGGTIANSTGAAVQITNSTTVNLNNMMITGTNAGFNGVTVDHNNAVAQTVSITNTTITGGLEGVDYNRTASGTSRITLTGNTINTTAGDAVNMNIGGSGTANVVVTNNAQLDGGDDQAFALAVTGGAAKNVLLLVDGNTMSNNSLAATAELDMNGGGTLNATVTNNTFTNGNAATGRGYDMASTSGIIRLNLNDNQAITGNATPEYLLTEGGGDFRVEDLATVDARNVGDIEFQPNQAAFTDDPGPIPTP